MRSGPCTFSIAKWLVHPTRQNDHPYGSNAAYIFIYNHRMTTGTLPMFHHSLNHLHSDSLTSSIITKEISGSHDLQKERKGQLRPPTELSFTDQRMYKFPPVIAQ